MALGPLRLAVCLLAVRSAATLSLGVNLNELTPYQNQWPFLDLFKHSSPFFPYTLSWSFAPGSAMTLSTATGYPALLAPGTMATAMIGRPPLYDAWNNWPPPPAPAYAPGSYVVLWDGCGNITITGDGNATFFTPPSASGGRGLLSIPAAAQGLAVQLTAVWGGEAGHLRNLRILPAASEGTYSSSSPFAPRFLELLGSSGGGLMLRASGWQRETAVLSAARGPWAARTLPTSPTQLAPDGVAAEHIAALALATNASALWLSAPAQAPEDYLAGQAALYVGALLAPGSGFGGRLLVESGGGAGFGSNPGPRTMRVIDAWEGALRSATASAAAAARTSGARAPGLDALDCPSATDFAAALATLATRAPGVPSGLLGDPAATPAQRARHCALPALAALYASLRARVAFVHNFAMAGYWEDHTVSFVAAASAWNAAAGLPALPTPAPTGPPLWAYAFARLDALAHPADAISSSDTLGSVLGLGSPSADTAGMLAWTQGQWGAALRAAILSAEVENNRFAAKVASLAWGAGGPNSSATSAAWGKVYGCYISAGGWGALRTPDFGAAHALASARRSGANSTVLAALAPAAALETALATALPGVVRGLSPDLLRDHLLRHAAAGFQGYFAGDLMRAPNPPMTYGLLGRASGATAVCEGYSALPCPTLQAFAAVAAAAPGPTCSSSSSSSTVPYLPPPQPLAPAPTDCTPACVWGTCYSGACVCFPGVSGADCATIVGSSSSSSSSGSSAAQVCGGATGSPSAACAVPGIGINPAGLAYWSSVQLYRNLHRQGDEFIPQAGWQDYGSQGWRYGLLPPLLPRSGYPTAGLLPGLAMGSMHIRDLKGHYTPGTYVLRWEGDATLDVWMDDVKGVRRPSPGYMEVDLLPTTGLNNGLFVRVERSSPCAPLRNLTILPLATPPALAAAFPFTPSALAFFSNFSTLRFMDLGCTNCDVSAWTGGSGLSGYSSAAHRPLPSDRTHTPMGMPLEHQILLANSVGAHAWVNMPHAWDNASVSLAAAAWARGLRPGLNLTLEYSNEVWGTLFLGGQYAQAQGVALGLGGSPLNNDNARFCYLGLRTLQLGELFTAAGFPRQRLRLVIASQFVNADVTLRILACSGGAVGAGIDAVALGPYLDPPLTRGGSGRDSDRFGSTDGVLNATGGSAGPALGALLATAAQQRAAAALYSLPLLAYEGGQGMVGPPDSYLQQELAIAVNRDPRMAALYTNYTLSLLQAPQPSSAPLFAQLMHFSSIGLPSRYGSWGLMEGEDSTLAASPKLQGLQSAGAVLAGGRRTGAQPTAPSTCPTNASGPPHNLAPHPGAPCSGAGTCVDDPVSGAATTSCACQDGYYGAACQLHAYLDVSTCSYQCSGHGVCALVSTQGFTRTWACACAPGYSGPVCTAFECPAHCSFNGRCVDAGTCACYEGYAGADCSVDCGCGEHGRCAEAAGAAAAAALPSALPPPSCVCDAGYAFAPAAPPALLVRGGVSYAAGACAPVCAPGLCSAGAACLRPGVCSCAPGCVSGTCVLGVCKCWAGYGGVDCSQPVAAQDAQDSDLPRLTSTLGINLGGVADWSTEWPFMDLAATARPWISQHVPEFRPPGVYIWDLGQVASPQNVSAGDNWPLALLPGQQLGTLMARDVAQRLPSGRYTVLYRGSGDLSFGFDARVAGSGRQVKRGRIELDVTLSPPGVRDNGIYMAVTALDPANPIRDIRVLMPGTEELYLSGLEFHPAFLATWVNASALRFMDMAGSNIAADSQRHTVANWAQRPTRASFSFQGRSIPIESMVHLANLLGADPWLNVHAQSPPDFTAAMAALVAAQLRPDLSPLLELGNELWSSFFAPSAALQAAASAAGVMTPVYVAQRAAALAAQWDAAFLAAAATRPRTGLPPRLILSTFTANPWYTSMMLRAAANCSLYPPARAAALYPGHCTNATSTFPAWRAAAGLGVSAYMDCGDLAGSPSSAAITAGKSVAAILAACNATLPSAPLQWAAHASPLPLAVYEGGPGLVEASAIYSGSTTAGLTALLQAASAAPAMASIYGAWLAGCGQALGSGRGRAGGPFSIAGGALPYMHFSSAGLPSIYGSWGAYEYTGAPLAASPRAQALVGAWGAAAAALAWRGCGSPGALNYRASRPPPLADASLCAFAPAPAIDGGAGGVAVWGGLPALAVRVPPGATALGSSLAMTVSVVAPRAIASVAAALAGAQGSAAWAAAAAALTAANASSAAGAPAAPATPRPQRLLATPVFDLGPTGTVFAQPVRLCIDVNVSAGGGLGPLGATVNASAGSTLALYTSSDGGLTWAASENSSSTLGGGPGSSGMAQLCGAVWHFSYFAGFVVQEAVLGVDVANATAVRLAGAGGAGVGTGGGGAAGAEAGAGAGAAGPLSTAAIAGIAAGALMVVLAVVAWVGVRQWGWGGGARQAVLSSKAPQGPGQGVAGAAASQRFTVASIMPPQGGAGAAAGAASGGGAEEAERSGQRSRVSQILPAPAV